LPRRRRKPKRPRGGSIRRRRSTRRSRGEGESRSDVEAELESEESMEMGDDTSASEDEGVRGTDVNLVEPREPMAVSVGGGPDVETRGNVPELRKHAMSEDAALE